MSEWISGQGIIKERGINTLEFLKFVATGASQPHDKNYNPVPPPDVQQKKIDLEEYERRLEYIKELLPFSQSGVPCIMTKLQNMIAERKIRDPQTFADVGSNAYKILRERPVSFKKLQEQKKSLEKTVAVLKRKLSEIQNSSWKGYWPDAENINLVINYLKNSLFKRSEVDKAFRESAEKKLRPNQEARIKCREVAKKLIIKHTQMGIDEMADHPEIKEHGGNWTRRTRHEWICDLFPIERRQPGRKPGNRTKSKKNPT